MRKAMIFHRDFSYTSQISLNVDGAPYPELWKVSGPGDMLATVTAYVGGSEAPFEMPGQIGANSNFVGCLRKVGIVPRCVWAPYRYMQKEISCLRVQHIGDRV